MKNAMCDTASDKDTIRRLIDSLDLLAYELNVPNVYFGGNSLSDYERNSEILKYFEGLHKYYKGNVFFSIESGEIKPSDMMTFYKGQSADVHATVPGGKIGSKAYDLENCITICYNQKSGEAEIYAGSETGIELDERTISEAFAPSTDDDLSGIECGVKAFVNEVCAKEEKTPTVIIAIGIMAIVIIAIAIVFIKRKVKK